MFNTTFYSTHLLPRVGMVVLDLPTWRSFQVGSNNRTCFTSSTPGMTQCWKKFHSGIHSGIEETGEKFVKIHNRCYRFKFQFPGEMLDDHLCPTKFQLLLSMEFGCSVPRDRMDRIKICCIGLASLAKNNCFEEIRGRGLQDWELFDWVAPKE